MLGTGSPGSAPAEVAHEVLDTPFDDPETLEIFCAGADVVTSEFENIPATLLEAIAERVPMRPAPQPVIVCQHREREKRFLEEQGIPCAPFRVVSDADELAAAMADIGPKGVLKTAEFGYDGKGQVRTDERTDPAAAWAALDAPRGVFEQWIEFVAEASVMVVRGQGGDVRTYDPAENTHLRGILHTSVIPARLSPDILDRARRLATRVAEAFDYVGIMGVEFFVLGNGDLVVNEMAPRPHNSGHHTLDACETSQFEQQLRAACGLPLGSTHLLAPAVMWNLLGDAWPADDAIPDWSSVLQMPGAKLHLYGKERAPVGRKMGHVTFLAGSVEEAVELSEACMALYPLRS